MQRSSVHLLVALAALGCSSPESGGRGLEPSIPESLVGVDTESWVSIYEPKRAYNGFTLDLYRGEIPILFDMNGRVVHSWPHARVKSRVRLLEDGSLLGIGLGRGVVEYDWQGRTTWEAAIEDGFPHHDLVRRANGNTLVLIAQGREKRDSVIEMDRAGEVVWRWDSGDHLGDLLADSRGSHDLTHINSIQELPPNRWFDAGDERFRPGNLLLSARNLDRILIVDRKSKAVVWSFAGDLDMQHEALMVQRGWPSAGNILLFNNRFASFRTDRQSSVLEIDPPRSQVVRRLAPAGFYSPTSGVQQPLPNGNILVGSSRGSRVFEADSEGEIVWQWTPPFQPTRPGRYRYDHSPQLVSLGSVDERRVAPPESHRFYEIDTRRFARRGARRDVRLDGEQRSFLAANDACSEVLVPALSELKLAFGVHGAESPVRFSVGVGGEGNDVVPFAKTVEPGGSWHEGRIDMTPFGDQWARICLSVEALGNPDSPTEAYAFWEQPSWEVPWRREEAEATSQEPLRELTEEERRVREEHLRTMGYVN